MQMLHNLGTDEGGQTYVEYAALVAIISLGLVVSLGLFETELENVFTTLTTTLATFMSG